MYLYNSYSVIFKYLVQIFTVELFKIKKKEENKLENQKKV